MPTLFDFNDLEARAESERDRGYAGPAPLGFTTAYFTPDELRAAHEEQARLRGPHPWAIPAHTWHPYFDGHANDRTPGHDFWLLNVDLRCQCHFPYLAGEWEAMGGCRCVGTYLFQANCPDCRWHALGDENDVVEAWYDHAWPGWRDLPVMPLQKVHGQYGEKGWTKWALAWIRDTFPAEWQTDGAPIITQRSQWGTRHVPLRSPWGGHDLSSTAVGAEMRVW